MYLGSLIADCEGGDWANIPSRRSGSVTGIGLAITMVTREKKARRVICIVAVVDGNRRSGEYRSSCDKSMKKDKRKGSFLMTMR